MIEYVGGFKPGDIVKVNGTPLHNGKIGTVVEWTYKNPPRRGLVPVFMPEFGATRFWWISPLQLKEVI